MQQCNIMQVDALCSLFPMLEVLDASCCIGPSLPLLEGVSCLDRLRHLVIRGNHTSANLSLNVVARLTGLTSLEYSHDKVKLLSFP